MLNRRAVVVGLLAAPAIVPVRHLMALPRAPFYVPRPGEWYLELVRRPNEHAQFWNELRGQVLRLPMHEVKLPGGGTSLTSTPSPQLFNFDIAMIKCDDLVDSVIGHWSSEGYRYINEGQQLAAGLK